MADAFELVVGTITTVALPLPVIWMPSEHPPWPMWLLRTVPDALPMNPRRPSVPPWLRLSNVSPSNVMAEEPPATATADAYFTPWTVMFDAPLNVPPEIDTAAPGSAFTVTTEDFEPPPKEP